MIGHHFLSYARSDATDIVKKLRDDLEKYGFTTWLDTIDITSGDWDSAIDEGLHSARAVLVIMTSGAVMSLQVKSEWNDALSQYLPVIPLLFKPCQIPRVLRVFNYVDFTENYDDGFQQLVTVLETLAGHHLEYLKQTLRALGLAQQESTDPRRFRSKIQDLRDRINHWEAQYSVQDERIYTDLKRYRREVNTGVSTLQQERVLYVVGQRPLDVIAFFKDRIKERHIVSQLLADPNSRLVSIIGRGGMGKTAIARVILHNIEQGQWQHTETNRNDRNVTWDFDGYDRDGKQDIREIDGTQLRQVREALLSAFPTRQLLEMMVLDQLNENLLALVGESSFEHMVFELIRWSISRGRLEKLVNAALKQNDQNPQLMSVAKQLQLSNDQSSTRNVLTNEATQKIPTSSSVIPIFVSGIAYLSTMTTGISWEKIFTYCSRMFDPEIAAKLQRIWENGQLALDEKISQLITACNNGLYILLLDNFEELLNDQGKIVDEDLSLFLEKVLLGHTSLRLLITSRIPLSLKRSLAAFDKQIYLRDGLPPIDAVQLLRDLDPNGNYGLYDALDTQLTDLAKMTHGVPRALESVVGLLANDPFLDINELLSEFFQREDVVRDLIEENYRRLDLPARRILQALSIFRRPVMQFAIEYLLLGFDKSIDVATTLRRLINTHIINVDRTSKTIYLHPIDQDYAYSQIPDGPVQALLYSKRSLESRAADYYAQLKMDRKAGRSLSEIQYHVLEIEHRIRADEYNKAAEVLLEISTEAANCGYANTMQEFYTSIVEKVSDKRLQMLIEHENILFSIRLGLLEEAASSARSTIELAHELGDRETQMKTLGRLAATMRFLGYLNDSARYMEEAEGILNASGDPFQDPELLFEAGLIAVYRKKYQQSIQYAQNLSQPAFASRTPFGPLFSANLLSVNYLVLNKLDQALEHTNQWIKRCRELNQRDSLVYAYNTLGLVQASFGHSREALNAFTEALEMANEDSNLRPEGMILHNLARFYRMQSDLDSALNYANSSVVRLKQVGAKYLMASEALVAAIEAAKRDEFRTEIKTLIQCAEIAKENPDLMDALELLRYVEQLADRESYSELLKQVSELISSIKAARQM